MYTNSYFTARNQAILPDLLVPSYFFIASLSWPAQVLLGSPWPGLLCFIPLLIFSIHNLGDLSQIRIKSWHDAVVLLLVGVIASHAIINVIDDPANFFEHCKGLLVVTSGVAVYFIVSRTLSSRSLTFVFIAISLAALIISLQWMYDSYVRTVLHQESSYYHKVLDYILARNGFQQSEINWSVVGPQYRSYGLLDKHTTTGAYVALGSLAALTLLRARRSLTLLLMFCSLMALFVGGATGAFLTGSIVLSIASFCTILRLTLERINAKRLIFAALCVATTWLVFIAVVAAYALLDKNLGILFLDRSGLFHMQLSFLTNFNSTPYSTGVGDLTVSMPGIATSGALSFIEYALRNTSFALFGQGLSPLYQQYPTGGDLGILDFVATFGLPISALFFLVCLSLMFDGWRYLYVVRYDNSNSDHIIFAIASVLFLLVTQAHYDVMMKKEMLPILFLALGLMRRYGLGAK